MKIPNTMKTFVLGALVVIAAEEWKLVPHRIEVIDGLSLYADSEWNIIINFPFNGRTKRVRIPKSNYPMYITSAQVWDSHCKDPLFIDDFTNSEVYDCLPGK